MPRTLDSRCGYGWFDFNTTVFYEFLSDITSEELIIKDDFCESERKYHETAIHDEMEFRMNEWVNWRIFETDRELLDEDDLLPSQFQTPMAYIYYHVVRFIKNHASWYQLKKIN